MNDTARYLYIDERSLDSVESIALLLETANRGHITDLFVPIHRYDGLTINCSEFNTTSLRLNNLLPFDYIKTVANNTNIHAYVNIATYQEWLDPWVHLTNGKPPYWNARTDYPQLTDDWLNFADNRTIQELVAHLKNLCTENNLKTLHIDYIRLDSETYNLFTENHVTNLVNTLKDAISNVDISAAVVPAHREGYSGWSNKWVSQNWPEWLRENLVVGVHSMNYASDYRQFIQNRYIENDTVSDVLDKASHTITNYGWTNNPLNPSILGEQVDINREYGFTTSIFDGTIAKNPLYADELNQRPLNHKPPTSKKFTIKFSGTVEIEIVD